MELLSDAAQDVFAELVGVQLRLPECEIEHKKSLRRWLKPEAREAQGFEFASVQKMNDFSSVNRVSCEPVGMPCKNAACLSSFDGFQHFDKDFTTGFPRRSGFAKRSDDVQLLFCCVFTQFTFLCVHRKYLSVFLFR